MSRRTAALPSRQTRPRRRTLPVALAAMTALLGLAAAPSSKAFDARVLSSEGDVRINGQPLRDGALPDGAILRTGADGSLQLRGADGLLLALPPGSEVRLPIGEARQLGLLAGGLRLFTAGKEWRIELPDRSLRTRGYLKLARCAAGCALAPGLYGRIVQGEAVLEYAGGRSVLRARSFRWPAGDVRPEVLATAPALLDDDDNHPQAAQVRARVAALLKTGMDAFTQGDDDAAVKAFEAVRLATPGESLVPYYLGLVALKRKDNGQALTLLQQYAREDPEGATAREVPKLLTLLSSSELQQEVASAVAREGQVVSAPPEPGSIAVQAFVNRGDGAYRAMAKGLAAMVIADLSKVPGLKVLEREKVQLLVDEARLGDSGLADPASAVRSGRLMRAEKVVVGNFEVQ